MTRAIFPFAAALALSAGAASAFIFGGDRVISDFIDDAYEPVSASVFAGAGGAAAIYGATRDGADAEVIAAGMRLPAWLAQRRLTAGPTGERTGPHLVLVFAPKPGATPRKACRGEAAGGVAAPGELRVLAAFCSSYGRPVSEATLVAEGSPTPGDPAFDRSMLQLLNAIMPPRNPTHGGGIRRRG